MIGYALAAASSVSPVAISVTTPSLARSDGDCTVHVSVEDGSEYTGRCGAPIDVVRPLYAFVETATEISPLRVSLAEKARARVDHFGPKGTLRVISDGSSVEVLSLITPTDGAALRSAFARRGPSGAPLSVPAGRVIAQVFDRAGRLLEISEPIAVRTAEETRWRPESDRHRAVLIAKISRDHDARADEEPKLVAIDAAGSHLADAFVAGDDELVGVWYGLSPGSVRVVAISQHFWIRDATAVLAGGGPKAVEAALLPLPNLTVTIAASPEVKQRSLGKLELDVGPAADSKSVRRRIPVEIGRSFSITSLQPELVAVRLRADGVDLTRRVDLSAGKDATLTLRLQPIVVAGTLFRGDEPSSGRVTFDADQDIAALADDSGRFEATLWEPRRYIVGASVGAAADTPPFTLELPLTSSQHLDIHVPANRILVHVVDRETGEPVARASVSVANRWTGGGSAVVIPAQRGETALPPLHLGTAEVRARAAGYADSAPVALTVDDSLGAMTINIQLTRRAGSTSAFTITMPDSTPAAHAEVAAWAGERMLWHGEADQDGHVDVPLDVVEKQLIVRHPAAASAVLILANAEANSVRLEPAAPPLVVKVFSAAGAEIGPAPARITIWPLGGVRLTGAAAGFATWSIAATGPDSVFIARGLPMHAGRIVATTRATTAEIESGAYDRAATLIAFPWSGVNRVTAADQ